MNGFGQPERGVAMPRLARDLTGVEPVNRYGNITGPPTRLLRGSEFQISIAKLKRPEDSFDEYWCEIQVEGQLYRVALRSLDGAKAA